MRGLHESCQVDQVLWGAPACHQKASSKVVHALDVADVRAMCSEGQQQPAQRQLDRRSGEEARGGEGPRHVLVNLDHLYPRDPL